MITYLYYVALLLIISLVSIFVHELGHYIVARLFGFRVLEFKVSLLKGYVIIDKPPSQLKWYDCFFAALAGPAFSFLLALVGFILFSYFPKQELYSGLAYFNVVAGLSNLLLPLRHTDGYLVLHSWLYRNDQEKLFKLFYDSEREK